MARIVFSIALMSLASSAYAQSSGNSWTYHGLPNGPTIRSLDKSEERGTPFYWWSSKCASPVMVYTPHVTLAECPKPPQKLILGWHSFSSPSPRPTNSVGVNPK